MKGFTKVVKWFTAAALLVAMPTVSALAAKTTPATDKNTNVPAVPRAIPDLIPYHKFDPPRSKAFDLNKLTISGDIRVRPEFRTNSSLGGGKNNRFFTQQWVRLGFNYDISPDVAFFFQPQWSSNWGAASVGTTFGDPNSTATNLFARQAFMLIRNFVVKDLTMKAGRQLVVWGNHRMFGHFDWNNVGFSFNGVTFRYNMKNTPIEVAWIRLAETDDCASPTAGACLVGGTATADADIVYIRVPAKIGGIAIEPTWIWESGGAGATVVGTGGQPPNQTRHTVGGRVSGKKKMFDGTGEFYYQFGEIGNPGATRNLHINAFAVHADLGVTLPVPMQPRVGAEFNYASGDNDNNKAGCGAAGTAGCGGNMNTFSQLYPTNHIHFGYMDNMAWMNMVEYKGNLQLRPTKNSHFEVAGHVFRLANTGDNWYGAAQTVLNASPAGNQAASIGQEIDAVYTLFFQGNKVAWQLGYGHFFAGEFVDVNLTGNPGGAGSDWGYTQLWVNF